MDNYLKPYCAIELQRRMVSDRARTDAFAAAIREVVQTGDVVLDVGTGTGVLSMLAAKAGAKQVYGAEMTDIAAVAMELAERNGLADRIEFCRGPAGDLQLDQKVDVLISEWLGHAAFAEGMLHAVLDARNQNLAPAGKMMPSQVRVLMAPLDAPVLYHERGPGYWRNPIHGLDFGNLEAAELSQGGAVQIPVPEETLLAPGQSLLDFDMGTATAEDVSSELQLEFMSTRDGELNGFCVWFEADLSPSVTLDTGPCSPITHWAQTYLSFRPTPVRAGEVLDVDAHFFYDPDPVAISRYAGLCLKIGEHELRYLIE